MKYIIGVYIRMTVFLSTVILFSCNPDHTNLTSIHASVTKDRIDMTGQRKADYDTVVGIDDQSFHIQFWQDTSEYYSDANNTFLLVRRDTQSIFSDSLFVSTMGIPFELQDLNYDGNLDISLFKGTGGRGANEFRHWFIYNTRTHSFNRIGDIDELPTVVMDSSGLVISHAFYGDKMNQSYFYINKDFKTDRS